ncbi:MAG: maleylpyruvate isomerase N-terminal domain-containing protein [Chloroflexi bacterium]|nr:maleylpyruvate isomerase N-terminal domain-containing protein [Chloroflexota bacterium]
MPETKLTREQITNAYRAERRALGQLVESMNEFHWEKQSQCDGWTNGQVAAHLTLGDGIPWRVAWSVVSQISLNLGVESIQEKWAARGRLWVLDRIKSDSVSISIRWGVRPLPIIALAEMFIHGEDIRRSIDMQRSRPPAPQLTTEVLSRMGGRLREIGLPGLVSIGAQEDAHRVFELDGKGGIKKRDDLPEAPVKIIGEPLEQILRLSGRPARLRVEGEGDLAESAQTWADSRSESGRLFYWR